MQYIHVPKIDVRYWAAITLASIFGTNLGDYYAHESGLGLIGGLPILIALCALAFVRERFDKATHQVWYWLVIIIIRTGATNIADYLAFKVRLNMIGLCIFLALIIAVIAVYQSRRVVTKPLGKSLDKIGLPDTNAGYWIAMLSAGVFGTVLGDVCSHIMGGGIASIVLSGVLVVALLVNRNGLLQAIYCYWLTIAAARTAGTAIGDWFAENKVFNLGLPTATIITGCIFLAILLFWKSSPKQQPAMV